MSDKRICPDCCGTGEYSMDHRFLCRLCGGEKKISKAVYDQFLLGRALRQFRLQNRIKAIDVALYFNIAPDEYIEMEDGVRPSIINTADLFNYYQKKKKGDVAPVPF